MKHGPSRPHTEVDIKEAGIEMESGAGEGILLPESRGGTEDPAIR